MRQPDPVSRGRSGPSSTVFAVPGRISRSRLLRSAGGDSAHAWRGRGSRTGCRRRQQRVAVADGAEHRPPLRRRPAAVRDGLPRYARPRHGSGPLLAQPPRDRDARGGPHGEAARRASPGRRRRGSHRASTSCTWTPDPATPVGSYVMRLTIARPERDRTVLGGVPGPPSWPGRRRPSSACSGSRRRSCVARISPASRWS